MLLIVFFALLVMTEIKFDVDSSLVEWCKTIYENICMILPVQ